MKREGEEDGVEVLNEHGYLNPTSSDERDGWYRKAGAHRFVPNSLSSEAIAILATTGTPRASESEAEGE